MISSDIYFLDPINTDEMSNIELNLGRKIQPSLRSVISKVGFLQNAIGGNWPRSTIEFIKMQELIPNGHVAFMDDGSGNYYVISSDNRIKLWDHEIDKIISTEFDDLDSFIYKSLLTPEPLTKQSWHVQMAFDVNHVQPIVDLLSDRFGLTFVGEWEYKDTSPSGVSCYLLGFTEPGNIGAITKQTYAGWNKDVIYCNRIIPIKDIKKYQRIFMDLESDSSLKFKLIDYGIMSTDSGNDKGI